MTAAGWIFMFVSITMVLSLVTYCFRKMLTLPPMEVEASMHAPQLIDTGDTKDAD